MLSASNTDRWPQVVEGQIAIHQRHRSHGSSSQMIRIKNCGEQLSPDERLVATGGNSGIVTIWEVATAKPLRQVLQGLGENASREQPAPRPTAGSRFRRRPSGRSSRPQPLSSAKPGAAILSLAFSPDGKQLACGGESGVITLCNVVTGERKRSWRATLHRSYSWLTAAMGSIWPL